MSNVYSGKPARILNITKHTEVERSFQLQFSTPHQVPGQFVMVSLPQVGEVPISISGFTSDGIELTIRATGKVTSGLFRLKARDTLYVRGPYGQGFPLETFGNQHLLLIAGGSGVGAIKALIEGYISGNQQQVKMLDILVGFRSPKHLLFKKELKEWAKDRKVVVTVDKTEDDYESWAGGVGFVVSFIKDIQHLGAETHVVIVGPPLMMTNSVRELLLHNVREDNIWLSFERHMKCGVAKCGHCRIRDKYVCLDGPVFSYVEARSLID